jgi:hypothetical protein
MGLIPNILSKVFPGPPTFKNKDPLEPSKNSQRLANVGIAYPDIGEYYKAALIKVDPSRRLVSDKPSYFLLNPESWLESKLAPWAHHTVPGQSDPVLQWVSSGPRTITFDALITRDLSNPNIFLKPAEAPLNVFANIAAKLFNTAPLQVKSSVIQGKGDSLNISDYLNYYRSLLYPIYSGRSVKLLNSPPLVVLITGETFSKDSFDVDNKGQSLILSNLTTWVVTSLKINITKQLPNLDPMEAIVNFELTHYTSRPFGQDDFI